MVRDARGEVILMQPSLAEWLKVDRIKVHSLLNELAFQAHSEQTELSETADIPEERLIAGLMRINQNPQVNPAQLVEFLTTRAGLLLPRGVGVFTFPHRTIQEYLAACHLTDEGYPDLVAELARNTPDRWREVALLAGAKATSGGAFALWPLVDALCSSQTGSSDKLPDLWGALLAGQAILENANLEQISASNKPKVERVRDWQFHLIKTSTLPELERARAGDILSKLGDPRFDPSHWFLPAEPLLGFVEIPAGSFWMGSDPKLDPDASKNEQPQNEVYLPCYYMARYPVTVAQWRAFIDGFGYTPADPDSLQDFDSRPVRWVTWYDAMEYCNWLEKQLCRYANDQLNNTRDPTAFWEKLAGGELRVTLPSEAEWEKAARGLDRRIYPWGNEWKVGRCNSRESGLVDTCAAGCYPGGATPYGLLDMSGNVWEWTLSLWGKDFGKPEFIYPYIPNVGREDLDASQEIPHVLRGGSFYHGRRDVRCASRRWRNPRGMDIDFGFRVVVSPLSLVLGNSGSLGL